MADEEFKQTKAVALKYQKEKKAPPEVVAKGRGAVAEKIQNLAKENDVPLYNDKNLVEQLIRLEVAENIPPELYKAVAEVLVFVYSLDRRN
ncbi:EscU/YscU/HrcU family type III secretion system export apparatus switch protein [Proteinivorax hydrogeniformans]|uniref:EscU/YscU/HrcU family type III secretion system export apparatus switch protein n=1 Tax=Proteinivorax hydrogeniformans TaxID=1826727 RepID=A0AAU8HX05_9FIRM